MGEMRRAFVKNFCFSASLQEQLIDHYSVFDFGASSACFLCAPYCNFIYTATSQCRCQSRSQDDPGQPTYISEQTSSDENFQSFLSIQVHVQSSITVKDSCTSKSIRYAQPDELMHIYTIESKRFQKLVQRRN
jgi:hypothetical protein